MHTNTKKYLAYRFFTGLLVGSFVHYKKRHAIDD